MGGDKSFPRSADDGETINATSLETDSLNIGDSSFVETGDFIPMLTTSSGNAGNTSSSSYTNVLVGETAVEFDFALLPSNVSVGVALVGDADAGSDEMDIRVHSIDQNTTVIEQTGITGSPQVDVQIGPTEYAPQKESGGELLAIQLRNGDNTTSVKFSDCMLAVGVLL